MKKSYIKPTVFVEHLAMKSSISTCGYVSTIKIDGDGQPCRDQFYNPNIRPQKGGLCKDHKDSQGPNVTTYLPDAPEFGTLVCSENGTCDSCFSCYHVPDGLEPNGTSSAYVGIS